MSRVSRARVPKAVDAAPAADDADTTLPHGDTGSACSKVMETIVSALNASQIETSGYTQAVPVFRKLYAQERNEFIAAMELALPIILEADAKKNDSFDHVSSALTTFVSAASKDDSLSAAARRWFLTLMAEKTTSSDKTTRKRACQLIGRTLHALPDSVEIEDDTYDTIEAALLTRVNDSIADVRTAAVKALHRLKDGVRCTPSFLCFSSFSSPRHFPHPPSLPHRTLSLLLATLATDASADVRAAVVSVIGTDASSLPLLVRHTRDVAASVRKLCFVKLSPLLPALLSTQGPAAVAAVLRQGVSDREASVVSAATNVIASWLSRCGDNLLTLLQELRIQETGTDGEYVLSHALHARLVKPSSLGVPCAAAALTPGRAAAWRCALDYAAGRGGPGHRGADDCARHRDPARAESLVPPTRAFCETLSEVYAVVAAAGPAAATGGQEEGAQEVSDARYMLHQLLRMSPHIDTFDAAGVSLIRDFLLDMLENLALDSSTVALTIAALRVVLPADSSDPGFRAWQRAQSQRRAGRKIAAVLDSHDHIAERLTSSSAIVECLMQVVDNVVATLTDNEDLAAERKARQELSARIAAHAAAAPAAKAERQAWASEMEELWAEHTESAAFEEACWRRLLDIARDLFGQMRGSISKHTELQRLFAVAVAPVLAGDHGLASVAVSAAATEVLGLRLLGETDTGFVRAHLPHLFTAAASPLIAVRAAAVAALGDILVAFAGLGPVDPADGRPAPPTAETAEAEAAGDALRLSPDEFDALLSILTTHALATGAVRAGAAASDPARAPDERADAASAPAAVPALRFAAVEALGRALLFDRLPAAAAAEALGGLLALLHRPDCDSDTRQALTVFFAAYASPQAMPVNGPALPVLADSAAAAAAVGAQGEAWAAPFGVGASDHAAMLTAALPTLVLASCTPIVAADGTAAGAGAEAAGERLGAAVRLLLLLLADKTGTPAARAALPRRPSEGPHAAVTAQGHYNVVLNKGLGMAATPLARFLVDVIALASAAAEVASDVACALAKAVSVVTLADPDLSVQPPSDALPTPALCWTARAGVSCTAVVAALDSAPAVVTIAAGAFAAEAVATSGAAAAVNGNMPIAEWVAAAVEARTAALTAAVEEQEEQWSRAQDACVRRGAGGRVTRAAAKKAAAPAAASTRTTRAKGRVQQPESDGDDDDDDDE